MKKSRYSDEQTVRILRGNGQGPVPEVKKLLAERDLEIGIMKEITAEKW